MWIITEDHNACNLFYAYRIYSVPVMKGYNVIAEFLVATGTNDEHYAESAVIKSFETEDNAKEYIAEVVADLNNFAGMDLANKSCVFKKSETIINSERNVVISTEGAGIKLNSIKALFVFDDKAFAVVDSEPVLLFNPTSDFSAVNEEESEHFIENLAPYCDQLRRIRDTYIFFNKLDAGCTCIDPKCSVYVVVDSVLIFVKTFQTFTGAKNYCKFLQKEYDF